MKISRAEAVEKDSRGILDPWLLHQRVRLTRYPVDPALSGLVDRFWAVTWDLPAGTVHTQQLLTHPGSNISIGHPDAPTGASVSRDIEARLNGVARNLSTRTLWQRGWTVAAMTTPGGLGAFISQSAVAFTDRIVPLAQALDLDEGKLIGEVTAKPDERSRVEVLAGALEELVRRADPQRLRNARLVARAAQLAEHDRSLRRLFQLCDRVGVGPRSLQRMFLHYAGVTPVWVVRRYRLLDAAEAVRDGQPVSWAALAAALGYADQAHLSRDFHAAIGKTPTAYAASIT